MSDNPLNKFKSPGVYVKEKDINVFGPEGGYYCSQCHKYKFDINWGEDIAWCYTCESDTSHITLIELNKIQRDSKIEKLLEDGN
jgi:hypothetical protein